MEAQAEVVERITPEMIGNAFVSQFYSILHQTPELVHRFYQDTSTMSRPTPDGSLTTVTTMKEINDLMLSLHCKDYKAEIMTADTQASHKEGVIVLVTGCLTGRDNVRRKFTESFFLAPQSNGYYVLNDAFRFIAEDEPLTATLVEVKESDEKVTASTIAEELELVEVADKSLPNVTAAVEPVSNGNIDVCDKPDEPLTVKEHVVAAEPPVELVSHIVEQVVVESSSDVQDAPKKSYASIVSFRKESMRTTPAHAPSKAVKKSSTSNQTRGTTPSAPKPQANGTAPQPAQQLKEDANSTSAPESSDPNGNTRHGNGIDKPEEKGYSIYIGNLPFDATVEHVEQEFKKFGPIKKGGIQVRCSKGFCFGFVEYESLSSLQKALEASAIQIGAYEAFIEEKKTSTRVVNGVPTFSSGRGGYRNNGFRSRGNFSSGRGFGRNDYARRGDYGNGGRSGDYGNGGRNGDYGNGGGRNGDGYHGGYQNGGGRTARQGGPK